ncbi:cadherin-like domain-containing protein, partial [Shewanella sp. 4_MG-2023]|uniref:cadherin-like domain-containing protein n=1 Tax=Shewanella sp. 4_MG-2023 TaxID=3062652 RepID=UPI0026E37D68
MSNDNLSNNPENDALNDAVEQVNTEDSTVSSSKAENNQSTVTNTVATATSSVDIQTAEESLAPSGGSESSTDDSQTDDAEAANAEASSAAPSSTDSQSSAVESSTSDADTEAASSSAAEGAANAAPEEAVSSGAQSIGGAEGASTSSGAPSSSATASAATPSSANSETEISDGASSTDASTATNSETFEVNVSSDNNADGQIDADDLPTTDTTTDSMSFNVDVTAVNDAAEVEDQAFSMNEDGVIIITDEQLLAGATDVDGDDLLIDSVTYTGTDGVLTDNGDGTHSFAPNENFNGDVQLEFGVSDGTVVTPANIDIAVADVNDAPVAGSTSYTVNEDGQITISAEQLLANSSDVDGTVSLDSVSYSGTDGILVQNQDGSVTFSPNENFNGDISLDVTIIDDDGATAETTAGITTLAVNDAPVVDGNVAYSVDEDGSITLSQEQLLANATDIDGDSLSAENLSVGDNATVVANPDGSFTVTPDADFNGDLDLSFDVSDGTTTVAAGVDLTVNPVNDAAVAPDVEFTMNEDGIIIITDEQLLAGASDIDGDNLSIDTVTYTGTDGVLTDNGDGTHSFAPN